jgi:hypothetical protein
MKPRAPYALGLTQDDLGAASDNGRLKSLASAGDNIVSDKYRDRRLRARTYLRLAWTQVKHEGVVDRRFRLSLMFGDLGSASGARASHRIA